MPHLTGWWMGTGFGLPAQIAPRQCYQIGKAPHRGPCKAPAATSAALPYLRKPAKIRRFSGGAGSVPSAIAKVLQVPHQNPGLRCAERRGIGWKGKTMAFQCADRDSCAPETGGTQLVASFCGTQMLRMRRFVKDRCGYDARNTGLRHNRSLPRCRKRLEQSRSHLTTALIPRSTHVRHTVLCDHLQSTRTNHQPLSNDSSQASERSLQFDPQSNARLFHETKSNEGSLCFHVEETIH